MSLFSRSPYLPLTLLFLLLLNISCRKKEHETLEPNHNLHQVSFNFSNFQSEIQPFNSNPLTKSGNKETDENNHPEGSELLGYVNFNNKSFEPNYNYNGFLKVGHQLFNKKALQFVPNPNNTANKNNFAFKADSLIRLWLDFDQTKIHEIDRIEFDLLSMDEQQKNIYLEFMADRTVYRDLGMLMELPTESNPVRTLKTYTINFPKRFNQNKKETSISLEMRDPVTKGFYIKNLKNWHHVIDNIRVYGKRKKPSNPNYNDLPYFIFKKKTGEVVQKGTFDLSVDNKELLLELPNGAYYNVILFHDSPKKLILPSDFKNKDQLYVSQFFDDKYGRSFAALDSFELKENVEKKVTLKRLYSMVTLDFTDMQDLDNIKKVKVKPITAAYFWKPFNTKLETMVPDNSPNQLEFEQDFNVNKEVSFNHFIGFTDVNLPVQYEIEVWDNKKVIRKLNLKSQIKNNVKLIFKGPLYPTGLSTGFFEIIIDESWGDQKVVEFS